MALNTENGKLLVLKGKTEKIKMSTCVNGVFNDDEQAEKILSIIDTSEVTSMKRMFYMCNNLTTLPEFDTSNVTNMQEMFILCSKLTKIPRLNASKVTNMTAAFTSCSSVTSFEMYGMKCSFDASRMTKLGHDALLLLLNNLGMAESGAVLTLGNTLLSLLSDDEKAIATNKGWTLE